jgi:hypothetical protein
VNAGLCEHGPVVDGCRIRELPDGGREFVLDEPDLSFIRVDLRSRLQFGRTEVAIAGPFILEVDGAAYRLDPQRRSALGPFVALYPGTVRWLWTSIDGVLTVEFRTGAKVIVEPDPTGRSWSVGESGSVSGASRR